MATMGIYTIINRLNGKRYIGASEHIEHRVKAHLRPSNPHPELGADIRYYGLDAFVVEVLEEVPSRSELWSAERRWMGLCDPTQLYNRLPRYRRGLT